MLAISTSSTLGCWTSRIPSGLASPHPKSPVISWLPYPPGSEHSRLSYLNPNLRIWSKHGKMRMSQKKMGVVACLWFFRCLTPKVVEEHVTRNSCIPCWEFTHAERTKKTWPRKNREKKCHRFFFQMSGLSSYPLGILIYFEDMSIIILLYTFFFGDDSSEIADESRRITLEFIGKSPKGNLFFCQSLCKAAAVMQVSWFHLQNWKQQSIWKSYLYLMNQMPNNFNNLEDFGCKIINLKKWSCFVHFSLI